jgi:DNA (cytosine-5)-methyltransferase 3A
MSTKDEQEILTLEHYLELKAEGFEFEGQSYLFWEYMRLLNEVKPKYFLLENVMMGEKWEKVLSKAIGVNPIMINSSLVSAQNRQRLYWTNIGLEPRGLFGYLESIIQQPKDKCILLKDILEQDVDTKYFLSDKMINWLDNHAIKRDVEVKKLDGNQKSSCLTATAQVKQNLSTDYIVHNMMPRSSTSGKGGTGHLTRQDGKTYCLDTGSTNAIEIFNNSRLNKTISKHRDDLTYGTMIDSYNKSIHKEKSITISTRVSASNSTHIFERQSKIRRLTPIECERLQTVKDNYTNHVSDSQRYKMLGNGWTVDVIAHILSYIKWESFFKQ